MTMRIYLDLCCFNRPYDDQLQTRIRLETEAKFALQQKIRDGECELVWSAIMDYENAKSPFPEHRDAIGNWRKLASLHALIDAEILSQARQFMGLGIREYDALHVASAVYSQADIFVSTDDRLLKKLQHVPGLRAMLPGDALAFLENWYEN